MSHLRKDLAKAKMTNQLPHQEPWVSDPMSSIAEDDSSSSASSVSSTGTIRPNDVLKPLPNIRSSLRSPRAPKQRRIDPLDWHSCFAQDLYLRRTESSEEISHHVYVTSPSSRRAPVFVMHHGAGSSGLTFAVLTARLRVRLPDAGFLSLDARGHGDSTITVVGSGEVAALDLSLETLSNDLYHVIRLVQQACKWDPDQKLVFVGHSLGGAVITHLVNNGIFQEQTVGYAVIDVVEGSAIDALSSMQSYLSTRPLGFESLEKAIEWHLRSRTVRDPESARTSVPSLLRAGPATANGQNSWLWRTNLAATQPFWGKWFVGLSSGFLKGKGAKLLILAGTDRLDKELIIGQMQGKFQLSIVPEAGHFVHEDVPEKIADILAEFWRRNDIANLVLPPKVGALLAVERDL